MEGWNGSLTYLGLQPPDDTTSPVLSDALCAAKQTHDEMQIMQGPFELFGKRRNRILYSPSSLAAAICNCRPCLVAQAGHNFRRSKYDKSQLPVPVRDRPPLANRMT